MLFVATLIIVKKQFPNFTTNFNMQNGYSISKRRNHSPLRVNRLRVVPLIRSGWDTFCASRPRWKSRTRSDQETGAQSDAWKRENDGKGDTRRRSETSKGTKGKRPPVQRYAWKTPVEENAPRYKRNGKESVESRRGVSSNIRHGRREDVDLADTLVGLVAVYASSG